MTQTASTMPEELAEIYNSLYQHIAWLHARWQIFCQLYATSKETVELLNRSAPVFFRVCQDVFADDMLLTISRLTDPKQTGKKDNLSLDRLISCINPTSHPTLRAELDQMFTEAKTQCSFARDLRNRRIAHSDLATELGRGADPLPMPTKQQIEGALQIIRKIMNKLEEYFDNNPVSYEDSALPSDGIQLLARLKEADAHRKQRRQQLRSWGTENE